MVCGLDARRSPDPILMMMLVRMCFSALLPYHTVCKAMLTFCQLVIMALVLLMHDR